jgi:hypothetical protein
MLEHHAAHGEDPADLVPISVPELQPPGVVANEGDGRVHGDPSRAGEATREGPLTAV